MRRAPYNRKARRLERERRAAQSAEGASLLEEHLRKVTELVKAGWSFDDEGRFVPPASGLNQLRIVEGVASVWHYHLSVTGENGKPALCGDAQVMQTQIPLSGWGVSSGSIRCSYCDACDRIRAAARRN